MEEPAIDTVSDGPATEGIRHCHRCYDGIGGKSMGDGRVGQNQG